MFRIWYSTRTLANWLVVNSSLRDEEHEFRELCESDASKPKGFHKVPTHLKSILYLDAPDIIVEYNNNPVFSLELSSEAGTGHNVFQRFSRIVAAVENNVPAFYIYPEAVYVQRETRDGWDALNPLIFDALEKLIRIHNVPAFLYYYPSDYRTGANQHPLTKGLHYDADYHGCPTSDDPEMHTLFRHIDQTISAAKRGAPLRDLINTRDFQERRDHMQGELHNKIGDVAEWSPLTALVTIDTDILLRHFRTYSGRRHDFGILLPSRRRSVLYKVNAKFRGDPYPGALAAIDYLKCRNGTSFEDRDFNLVMVWGDLSINQGRIEVYGDTHKSIAMFMNEVRKTYTTKGKLLLRRKYSQLRGDDIPRYFMQVRFGSTFTKVKHIRVYSYFCDALLFHDGALWREG